mgnify:CR=1 FL=1
MIRSMTGFGTAAGMLGRPDVGLVTMTEMVDNATRIADASDLPLIADADNGFGGPLNVRRAIQLYERGGVAAVHLEDQVLPKRCGHIGGKALIPASEMIGKLRMARAVASDLGNDDFVVIARTDGVSAVDAPEPARGLELAVERALRYLDTGIPDLVWCEFPTSERGPVESFAAQVHDRFPEARFAFNWSSSFKWFNDASPITFDELGELGYRFVFITLGAQHAEGWGLSQLLREMAEGREQGYVALQRREWDESLDVPTRSHHLFSGVPYHHLMGKAYDAARLGGEFVEELPEDRVV